MADLNRPPQPDDPNYAQWLYQFWLKNQQSPKVVVSAGTNSISNGTANFSNSNNVTFGMATNGVVTATATFAAGGGAAIGVSTGGNTSNTTGMYSTGSYVFVGGNNITLSQVSGANGATVTISGAAAGGAQTAISGIIGSNTTYTSGTVSFADGNGLSWGTGAGQQLSLTHTLQYLSNTSAITSNAAKSGFTTTTVAGSVIAGTHDSNGLKLAVPAFLTVAAGAGAAVSLSGNSTSAGAGYSNISSGTAIFAGGNNITLSQNGASITISGANVGGAQTGISGVIASNATYTSGTISFSDANGISWGTGAGQAINITHGLQYTSATSAITSNALNTSASKVSGIVANTSPGVGTATLTGGVSFSNANGMSFYTSAGNAIVGSYTVPGADANKAGTGFTSTTTAGTAIVATLNTSGLSMGVPAYLTAAAGGGGAAVSIGGNSTSAGAGYSNITSGTAVLMGGNNLTLSQNGASITISAHNHKFTISGNTLGTNSTSISYASTMHLVGAGMVSIGGTSDTIYFDASSATLWKATLSNNTLGAGSTVLSFGVNNLNMDFGGIISGGATSNSLFISGPASNVFQYTSNTSAITSNALNTSASKVSGIVAATNNTGGGTATLTGGVQFSSANGLTFYTSAGNAIVASYTVPTQTNQTGNLYVTANSTQLSSTAGIDHRSLSFAGAGIASVGVSGGVVVISVPTGGGAGDGVNIVQAGTLGTTGTTFSASTGTVRINGGNNITVSQNNSNDIVIIGPNAGGGVTDSHWQNFPAIWTAAGSTRPTQSTSIAFPAMIDINLSVGQMRMLRSVSVGVTSVATVANTSWGFTQNETHNYVFYSQGTGVNSLSFQSFTSTSVGLSMSVQGSVGAASNNISVKHSFNVPNSTGTSQFTASTAPAGSASVPFNTTHLSNFISGVRLWDTQFNASFPINEYWVVHGVTSTGTTGGASAATALTAATIGAGLLMQPMINSVIASFGTSNQAFNLVYVNAGGSFTTAGGGTINSIPMTNFSSQASNAIPYLYMDRYA